MRVRAFILRKLVLKMKRKTISMDDEIYEALQRIRAAMISAGQDMSFTGTVEVILLSGILGADKLDNKRWQEIGEFMRKDSFENIESLMDQHVEQVMKRMKEIRKTMEEF